MSLALFPNWIVRHLRAPNLHTASWLKRPVEVFLVAPRMTKLEIKAYLRVLYNLPVTKVHTANYRGKSRPRAQGKFSKCDSRTHARTSAQASALPPCARAVGPGGRTRTSKRRMCTSRTSRAASDHGTTSWRSS